eukprot:3009373-Prymnesium_polylepis.2
MPLPSPGFVRADSALRRAGTSSAGEHSQRRRCGRRRSRARACRDAGAGARGRHPAPRQEARRRAPRAGDWRVCRAAGRRGAAAARRPAALDL